VITAARVRVTCLARLRAELEAARRRAHAMADPLDDTTWRARPTPAEWSVAECLVHLNLSSRAMLPRIREALAEDGVRSAARARMDLSGALLWLALTVRLPVKTTEPFEPRDVPPRQAVLLDFDALQEDVIGLLASAEGRDLVALRIVSPFDARLRYNVYAAFRVLAAHQRVHLAQGERALQSLRGK